MKHPSLTGVDVTEQDLAKDLIAIVDAAMDTYPTANPAVLNGFRIQLSGDDANVLQLANELDTYLSDLKLAPLVFRNPVNEVRAIAAAIIKG